MWWLALIQLLLNQSPNAGAKKLSSALSLGSSLGSSISPNQGQ